MRIDEVISSSLEEGVNDPHIFKAVFMAGGPGSGKSFVSKNLLGYSGLRTINSDDIYEYLMGKEGLPLDPENIFSPKGQEIRGSAKGITQRKQKTMQAGRLGLLIDGTGKEADKIRKAKEMLEAEGYETMMLLVNTSLDVSQKRNLLRKRVLRADDVEEMWHAVQQNIGEFQQIFGAKDFHIIDNSGGLEDPNRKQNFEKVAKAVDKFLSKAPSSRIAKEWLKNSRTEPAPEPNKETPAILDLVKSQRQIKSQPETK